MAQKKQRTVDFRGFLMLKSKSFVFTVYTALGICWVPGAAAAVSFTVNV